LDNSVVRVWYFSSNEKYASNGFEPSEGISGKYYFRLVSGKKTGCVKFCLKRLNDVRGVTKNWMNSFTPALGMMCIDYSISPECIHCAYNTRLYMREER
jgi:hypothetical protein